MQRGNRFQGDPDRLGYKGRRTEGYGGRGVEPGDRESDRGAGNRGYNQGGWRLGTVTISKEVGIKSARKLFLARELEPQ